MPLRRLLTIATGAALAGIAPTTASALATPDPRTLYRYEFERCHWMPLYDNGEDDCIRTDVLFRFDALQDRYMARVHQHAFNGPFAWTTQTGMKARFMFDRTRVEVETPGLTLKLEPWGPRGRTTIATVGGANWTPPVAGVWPPDIDLTFTYDLYWQSPGDVARWEVTDSHANLIGFSVTTAPEPSTYALLGTGLLGVLGVARRRRTRA